MAGKRKNQELIGHRKRLQLSQREVAERIGTSTVNVNRWENGVTSPGPYFRRKLCELFEASAEKLGFGLSEDSHRRFPDAPLPAIWNVPYRPNLLFTGREEVLRRLYVMRGTGKVIAITQAQAITGLGGIGKTQVAIEYAYRHYQEYKAVLWVRADSRETILSDFVAIAHLLQLPEKDEQDQSRLVTAIRRWLGERSDWLLILDNADDVQVASDLIALPGKGHILLTSRAQNLGPFAQNIEIKKMDLEEGVSFLLRRAGIVTADTPLERISQAELDHAEEIVVLLDGLPLALDQVGAYIQETACGLEGYLDRYQRWSDRLLGTRDLRKKADHPDAVDVTLSLSFARVEQANPAAAELLQLCAFLQADAIPEEIIMEGAVDLGPVLGPVAADQIRLDFAVGELRRFSLVERHSDTNMLTIHRLVQAVLRFSMDEDTQRLWAERAVRAVNAAFPDVTFENWARCLRLLPQAQAGALLITQHSFSSPEAARLLNELGHYLAYYAHKYSEAEPLLESALAIREQLLGPEHPDTAETLHNLAELYLFQSKYAQAELLSQRAMTIYEQILEPSHPDVANTLNNLAYIYQQQGKYEQAEPVYQRALFICEQVLDPNHIEIANTLNNLALLYDAWGKYEQAEPLFQRSLAICEQVLGFEHPETASALNNLALLYSHWGKYVQAEPLYKRALTINEKVFGSEHPYTAETLDNLANLYLYQEKYQQAEPLHKRGLAIRERVLGPDHPLTASSLHNLALLYHEQGQYEQAEQLYKRCLSIDEKRFGSDHPSVASTLNELARLYHEQKRYEQAEALYQHTLAIFEQTSGPQHPRTAYNLHFQAKLYHDQGKYEQAEPLYRRALAIREQVLGSDHPNTARTLNELARLYHDQKQYELAEPLYHRALAIRKQVLGLQHPRTIETLENYADLLRETKREREATQLEASK